MSDRTRAFEADFGYCEFKNSWDGRACIEVSFTRAMEKKAAGKKEHFRVRLTLNRGEVVGLVRALRQFIKNEQATVDEMTAYIGRSDE